MAKWVLLLAVLIYGITGTATKAEEDPVAIMTKGQPKDVSDYINRQIDCDHWSGEDSYNAARAKEIEKAEQKLKCDTLEQTEASLRKKYAADPRTLKAIDDAKNFE